MPQRHKKKETVTSIKNNLIKLMGEIGMAVQKKYMNKLGFTVIG